MSRLQRSWWLVYNIGAVVVIGALIWVTVLVLQLERRESDARAEASYQEALRLALWRMDSWLAPQLARESVRPYYEYDAFYPLPNAYTSMLNEISEGQVLTPSPLLAFSDDYFRLHFQYQSDGTVTSPQVPTGNIRDLAEYDFVSQERIEPNRELLDEVAAALTLDETVPYQMLCGEALVNEAPVELWAAQQSAQTLSPQTGVQSDDQVEWTKSGAEASRRAQARNITQNLGSGGAPAKLNRDATQPQVGPLVPVWLDADPGKPDRDRSLVFIRRGSDGVQEFYQGILTDWPQLHDALLEQVSDLFPNARLVPVAVDEVSADPAGTILATIPAALVAPRAATVTPTFTPARMIVALTWLAVIGAIAASGLSLRSSIAFAEKRSRFASAVTHELRTPLTTFRMYSEMLADGMIDDEDQRQTYYDTLKHESSRLSGLVENVLAYARLEERSGPASLVQTTVGDVLGHVRPTLEQRAQIGGMSLCVDGDATVDLALTTDIDVVGQVLFNLVDNACKYAGGADDKRVHVDVRADGAWACFAVYDHGPGIAAPVREAVFQPFERGERQPGDVIPGIGLGLALARGLARDLGGDLTLTCAPDRGARFEFRLPCQAEEH